MSIGLPTGHRRTAERKPHPLSYGRSRPAVSSGQPLLCITLRPSRVYLRGHRIHHFWLGLALILSDVRDWRRWVADLLSGEAR